MFNNYRDRVEKLLRCNGVIPIESHAQDLASLNNVLVLKSLQHSRIQRSVFTDKTMKIILNKHLSFLINDELMFNERELTEVNRILNDLTKKHPQSVYTKLMVFADA